MEINKICVCGSGTMGNGIAQAAAQAGLSAILYDINQPILDKARQSTDKNLQKLVDKQKISLSEKQEIIQRIQYTTDINNCLAPVIIEAIVENLAIKISLLNQLSDINATETILATNTSSLSVTSIAEKIKYPERVIGMHFFNPATIMKLVEIVKTKFTNEKTSATVLALAQQMNKVAVLCKDAPGFIVNRVARSFYTETLRLVEEGLVSTTVADKLLEASGFKMGPFKLMDLIGNDVNYEVSCSVYEQMNRNERFKPSYIQKEKVQQGKLGKKTGEGFYTY
ncbi:MAG: 3-hydroxyacyl-CoA dehydrogenase NAD-binding domain-containing protein [Chitinophagaceae bacterium]|nr:3-hydroxybutyryl-CoA dehydrogenase [Chitinophagaceae bacterium]MCB0740459.1 3-hydroxybutyryl-CoA dehydrogenase [Chitinophagaceae bacterium]HQU55966.1 3-hydroxyacyl-CoA dehydrogenase NAD-binding domain-containing protein [Chitinophagaceae bacterium]